MLKHLVPLLFLLCLTPFAHAAEILKATKRAVIIQFDAFEENYVTGDKLIASLDGKKQAIIQITKIKGAKMLGRILHGKATPGMQISRFDAVNEAEPAPTVPSETAVILNFFSNYVYRGIPENFAYVSGTVDYTNGGLLLRGVVSNALAPATSEVDLYAGYTLTRLNWSLSPMVGRYMFQNMGNWDTWDYMLNLTFRVIALDVSYIPEYFGVHSDDLYYRITTLFSLTEKWKFIAHAGYSNFNHKDNVGYKNYLDYKVGFIYSTPEFNVEFDYTDTHRKNILNDKVKDATAAVLISKRF
jgi:uncharacterized protein (TIGR02001 family)